MFRVYLLHSSQHPPRILSFSQSYATFYEITVVQFREGTGLHIYLSKGLCLLVCMFQPLSAAFLDMVVSHDLNHVTRTGAGLVELSRGWFSLWMLTVSFILLLYHFSRGPVILVVFEDGNPTKTCGTQLKYTDR